MRSSAFWSTSHRRSLGATWAAMGRRSGKLILFWQKYSMKFGHFSLVNQLGGGLDSQIDFYHRFVSVDHFAAVHLRAVHWWWKLFLNIRNSQSSLKISRSAIERSRRTNSSNLMAGKRTVANFCQTGLEWTEADRANHTFWKLLILERNKFKFN